MMEDRQAADAQTASAAASGRERRDDETRDEREGVRVNDRRRIHIDEETGDVRAATNDAPNLKPAYVEELETKARESEQRARAAEQKLVDVQARFDQVRAELQRDTDALRLRLQRTAEERIGREKAQFVAALLPVLDNLQRAMAAAEQGGSVDALLDGLRGTIQGFENALASSGVEPVQSLGARFDPELHEAVDTSEVEPEREGEVTAEHQRGYKIGNQLLRPARVQVGRARGGSR